MKYDRRALKRLLSEKRITVLDLAAQSGMTRAALYMIARGAVTPKATTLARIASVLDVPIERFFKRAA